MTRRLKCNLAAAVIFTVVGTLFYLAIDRAPPFEYVSGEVLPPSPPAGGQISIHWHLRINRVCPGWVEREIVDHRGYIWRNAGSAVRVASARDEDVVNTLELPHALGPTRAKYVANICFVCNPLHRVWPICVRTPELPFEIVDPAPVAGPPGAM